jgi:neutral ceramidase
VPAGRLTLPAPRPPTHPAAAARGWLVAAVLAVLACGAGHPGTAAACAECLRAGAALAPLRVPAGTSLAGYGALPRRLPIPDVLGRHPHAFWFRPSEGELDPLAARALVIEGGGERLAWISADLIAVDRALTERVQRRLADAGVPPLTLIVSASHTHSGPGGFLGAGVLGALSVEREHAEVREAVVGAMVESVRAAMAAVAPARVGVLGDAGPALTTGRLGHPADQQLTVMKVEREDGRPVAVLWSYAIHGTMLGPRNLHLSGDVMGLTSQDLERGLGVPVLYVNGAVGDASPQAHGLEAARAAAASLAGAVRALARRIDPAPRARLVLERGALDLPAPHLSLRNCTGGWVPAAVTVPLGGLFPRRAELIAGVLGDVAWVTVPGELQAALAARVKQAAGLRHAFVAGVSNDYLGYFVTAADYARPSYVSCASVYGAEAGPRLAAAAAALLGRLAARRP